MSIPLLTKCDTSYSIHPSLDLEMVAMDYGPITPRVRLKFLLERNSTSTEENLAEPSTTTGTSASPKLKRGYWYLATGYLRHPKGTNQAFKEAVEVQAALANIGIVAYSPIIMGHHIQGLLNEETTHEYWMDYNDPLIRGACGLLILMNEGWEVSRGIRDEYRIAIAEEKPCLFISYPLTAYNLETLRITISQFATEAG